MNEYQIISTIGCQVFSLV